MLSILAVCYLFLGGVGGGACFVLTSMALFSPRYELAVGSRGIRAGFIGARSFASRFRGFSCRLSNGVQWLFVPSSAYRRFFSVGYAASLISLSLGSICLIADLARSDRIMLLFVNPTFSFITLGTWLVSAAILLTLVSLALWGWSSGVYFYLIRTVQAVLVFVSFGVILYTGLLLQSISAVPLWATPWLPVLFVLSSLSCGVALVLLSSCFSSSASLFSSTIRRLLKLDALTIVLEAIAVSLLLASAFHGVFQGANADFISSQSNAAAIASVIKLLFGDIAWVFWLGFVAVGLLAPFVLECAGFLGRNRGQGVLCTAATCIIVGGFVMRYCIVMAGMHPVVASVSMLS